MLKLYLNLTCLLFSLLTNIKRYVKNLGGGKIILMLKKKRKASLEVTIKDIAKELKISIAAASKALNDLPGVSDPLRLKVKKTAETMGYKKYLRSSMVNAYERNLKFIIVLYGSIGGNLMEQLEAGVAEHIRKKGYYEFRYLIDVSKELNSEEKKELFLDTILREKGVVGVLACYLKISDVLIAKLYKNKIPVVLLENYTDFGRCITIDNVKASHRAVAKLIELGHRKIGCIMPQEDVDHVWVDRIAGYKKALRDKEIEYDPNLIVYENTVDMPGAGSATKELLGKDPQITAILYGSDRQAYGGMNALRELGKRIPEDIAIVGFDDIEFNKILTPSLSSVRQPIKELGELGINMLFESIEKNDFSHKSVVLDTELMLRGSCLKDYKEYK